MLSIGNKTFMNLQEAVGWLLENNALPFQSTANYVGNTEIAMSTLINPSPAKVRVGSIIFFADSKVSTVVGVTSNSFIVSDQYNDLVDDIVYVSNVAINASGHLIVTLSNGTDIDAGLIKQVSNFSINASQHLIANYNDGTTTDLGAIFSGNITIAGNLTVTGSINGESTPSVKPIYYHPIYMFIRDGNGDNVVLGTLTILDNQATPYTKTTLSAKLIALMDLGAYIAFNGGVRASGSDTFKQCVFMEKVGSDYKMLYMTSSGEATMPIDIANITYVSDGVNKIN